MKTVSPNETDQAMKLQTKSVMVVFGSGGHTTEMLRMLSHDASKKQVSVFDRYGKIYFVFGHSDGWSEGKVKDHFRTRYGIEVDSQRNVQIVRLHRAREVKQSYFTSIFSTLYAAVHSFWIMAQIAAYDGKGIDLLMTNGPGTALPLCYAHAFVNKIALFNIKAKIIFIESFCRVDDLSLTGKLLRPLLSLMPGSRFIVQWKDLEVKYGNQNSKGSI